MMSKPTLSLERTQRILPMRTPAVSSESVLVAISGWGVYEVRYRESATLGYQLLLRNWFGSDQSVELIRSSDAELHIRVLNLFGKSELALTPIKWADDKDETLTYADFAPQTGSVAAHISFDVPVPLISIKSFTHRLSIDSNPVFKGISDRVQIDLATIETVPADILHVDQFSINVPPLNVSQSSTK